MLYLRWGKAIGKKTQLIARVQTAFCVACEHIFLLRKAGYVLVINSQSEFSEYFFPRPYDFVSKHFLQAGTCKMYELLIAAFLSVPFLNSFYL